MRYLWFLIVSFFYSSFVISQVNHIEQQYLQDWLVLGSFPSHEFDLTSLPIPKEGTVVTGTDEKARTWKLLKSEDKDAHLYPFYQEPTDSTLYLFSQIESPKNQIVYLTFTGINYQDQLWINGVEIEAQVSNATYTYPIEVYLKSGLNVIYLKVSSDTILCQMWDPSKIETITGQVTDSNGLSVAGAEINLQLDSQGIYRTMTNNEGRYQIVIQPRSGKLDLSAQKGKLGTWCLDLDVNHSRMTDCNLSINPAVSITGTLVDISNQPHPFIIVEAIRTRPLSNSIEVKKIAKADESGKYDFINLKPGVYHLRCHLLDKYMYHRVDNQMTEINVKSKSSTFQADFTFSPFKKGKWRNYPFLEGLANIDVRNIYEDLDKIMWFGTAGGLSRFDSGKFENFSVDHGLPSNNIDNIYQSSDGKLWVSVRPLGTATYNVALNKFEVVEQLNELRVRTMYEDSSGKLWIGTTTGQLICYQNRRFDFLEIPVLQGKRVSNILSIYQDTDDTLWLGTDIGVYLYDGKAFSALPEIDSVIFHIGRLSSSGGILLVSNNYLYLFDNQELSKVDLMQAMPANWISSAYQDSEDRIWISGGWGADGVLCYKEGKIVTYSESDGLFGDDVSCVYRSSNGMLWFGVWGKGVSQYEEKSLIRIDSRDGLRTAGVGAIKADSLTNKLWLGSGHINQVKSTLATYDGQEVTYFEEFTDRNRQVSSIFQSNDGSIWVGTNSGVSKFEGDGFTTLPESENLRLFNITQSHDSSIWFGSRQGLYVYQKDIFSPLSIQSKAEIQVTPVSIFQTRNKTTWVISGENLGYGQGYAIIQPYRNNQLGLPIMEKPVWAEFFLEDKAGDLWFSSWGHGVYRYKQGKVENITQKDGLRNDFIRPICQGVDGVIWFGTNGAGLVGYNGEFWSSLDSRDGLMGDIIMSLESDNKGNIWCGTLVSGLLKYKRSDIRPKVKIDSVTTNKFYLHPFSVVDAAVGERVTIRFHAIDYITIPEKRQYRCRLLTHDKTELQIVTTSKDSFEYRFEKNGEYTFTVQALNRDLNLSEPAKVIFKVVLPWYLNGWIVIPSSSGILILIAFSIISGYRYQLKRREAQQLRDQMLVQERQNREVLEGKNEALTESYENLKQAQEQLIQTEKMASLGSLTAGIAHEIRNPLNFVNNFAELSSELTQELLEELQDHKEKIDSDSLEEIEDILDNLEQNLSRIDQHGKRADSIVNGMLLHSRGVSGERALTDLNALLEEYVNLAYHGLRAQDTSFNITIERDYDESLEQVNVVPQDISRVFLNILNNACYAAHQRDQAAEDGFTPTLWVSTKDVSNQVQIGIKDNGAGIPEEVLEKIFEPFMTTKPTGLGTGLGLSISYEIIVDEHQGQINVDTQEEEYTEFIITLPKSSESDSD